MDVVASGDDCDPPLHAAMSVQAASTARVYAPDLEIFI
jgi:hypothetical protein